MIITQHNTTFDQEIANRLIELTRDELVSYGVAPEDIAEVTFEKFGEQTYCITANNYCLFLGADLKVYTIVDVTSSPDEEEADMRYRGSLLYDAGIRPS